MILDIQQEPMKIQRESAISAYMLMLLGLWFFVIPRSRSGAFSAILFGSLFGLILYGVYDFTSAAVLKKWDKQLAIIDVAWGAFVFAAAALSSTLVR